MDNADMNMVLGTVDDVCDANNGIMNDDPVNVTAIFQQGLDFEVTGDTDYVFIADAANLSAPDANVSIAIWFKLESKAALHQRAFGKQDLNIPAYEYGLIPYHNVFTAMRAYASNADATQQCAINGVNPTVGVWYHMAFTYRDDNGTCDLYVNGTWNATANNNIAMVNTLANLSIGAMSAPTQFVDGVLDEAVVLAGGNVWNSTEIEWLFNSSNFSGGAPAPPTGTGCTVTLNTPADDDHTNDQTPTFNQSSIVCYGASMASRCYVLMNNTQSGDNSTSLTNNSAFGILANTSKAEGSYEWNITCIQGAVTNTTANRTLVIDVTAPQTFIYAPTASTTIYYGDLTYLDVAGFDIYMFNLTAEIFNGTGVTALATYNNDTGSAPWFNLTNEYVAGNDLYPGTYWVNASSMDSHTGKKWKPDHVETGADYIKVWKNGRSVKSSWLWNAEPDYELLDDRVKWSTVAQCDDMGDIKVKFNVLCSQEIRIIEGSEYAGHYVCAEMWGDFQDLADDGYDIKLVYESPVSLEVEIEKENAGDPFEWIWLDPATGGLNANFSLTNFTVLTDSALVVNTTDFFVGTVGYLIIYYTNITTDALITGANCSYNITDPYSNLDQGNATEGAAFYLANYTPTFTGLHSFAVMCNSSGWLTLNATGTFSVTSAPATTSIQVVPNSERMWTSATCTNSELAHAYESRVCFGSSCETVTVTEYEFCPLGCLQEGGALCRESLITSNPALVLLIAVILLAIVIFGLYAWARRVK